MKLSVRLITLAISASIVAAWAAPGAGGEQVESLSQYGVTWYFDHPVKAGTFITGDWWVIGPVTVTKVTPEPGEVTSSGGPVAVSRYGAAATKQDNRMRNGSMIVTASSGAQGYDSRLINYKPEDSVKFPVALSPQTSLISTISNGDDKVDVLVHQIMWGGERKAVLVLKAAAVLTVLEQEPPADAFRPPYAGSAKPIFRFHDVDQTKLKKLSPPKDMPSWEQMNRYLQRPWLDHMGAWLHQNLGPSDNQVNYGREFARVTGMAGLMLNTNATPDIKKPLLIGLIQLGIDLTGVIDAGRKYAADGGHYSGRKFPIVFAGYLLGSDRMLHADQLSNFSEDMQTYYAEGWAGQKALFQIVFHTGPRSPHEGIMPDQWNDKEKQDEGYRKLNSMAWASSALAVRIMGLVKAWNHDAWFDYCDRWMSSSDPYALGRQKTSLKGQQERPKEEGKTYDKFTDEMWAQYRKSFELVEWAGNGKMWVWKGKVGEWKENPKPAAPIASYLP